MAQYPMIVRGTTPTHTFNIPVDASFVEEALIIYYQNDKEVFSKETFDCDIEGKQIKTTLTQENTLALNHKVVVEIYCFFKTTDGTVYGSDSIRVPAMKGSNRVI